MSAVDKADDVQRNMHFGSKMACCGCYYEWRSKKDLGKLVRAYDSKRFKSDWTLPLTEASDDEFKSAFPSANGVKDDYLIYQKLCLGMIESKSQPLAIIWAQRVQNYIGQSCDPTDIDYLQESFSSLDWKDRILATLRAFKYASTLQTALQSLARLQTVIEPVQTHADFLNIAESLEVSSDDPIDPISRAVSEYIIDKDFWQHLKDATLVTPDATMFKSLDELGQKEFSVRDDFPLPHYLRFCIELVPAVANMGSRKLEWETLHQRISQTGYQLEKGEFILSIIDATLEVVEGPHAQNMSVRCVLTDLNLFIYSQEEGAHVASGSAKMVRLYLGTIGDILAESDRIEIVFKLFIPTIRLTFDGDVDLFLYYLVRRTFPYAFKLDQFPVRVGSMLESRSVDPDKINPLVAKSMAEMVNRSDNLWVFLNKPSGDGERHANEGFDFSKTYPQRILVLAPKAYSREVQTTFNLSDPNAFFTFYNNAAKFRARKRMVTLSWHCSSDWSPGKPAGALCRSSQPCVGLRGNASPHDEFYVHQLASSRSKPMQERRGGDVSIFDARPKLTAVGNQAFEGSGYEYTNRYHVRKSVFCKIGNIDVVKDAFDKLRIELMSNKPCGEAWLLCLKRILHASARIANRIERGQSILVHCSAGGDRTSQLTALAILILDPEYRTIEKFQVLVEREFIALGHKFGERLRNGNFKRKHKESPIFLQFLDCVWQLTQLFPGDFEFGEKFLLKLAEGQYAGIHFGFMFDTERERMDFPDARKVSIWDGLKKACPPVREFSPANGQALDDRSLTPKRLLRKLNGMENAKQNLPLWLPLYQNEWLGRFKGLTTLVGDGI